MTDDTDREAHAELYRRVADHLAVTAGKLRHLDEGNLDALDVAGLMASCAANILIYEYDRAHAVAFFRSLAASIEATGAPKVN